MKERKRLGSIIVFYVIAILFRFLAVKTHLLDFTDNEFIKILLRGIGPAIGAFVSVKLFNIPLRISLKGNYRNLFLPLFVFWIFPVVLIGTVSYIQQGQFPFVLLFTVLVYGLLEEIGWRGFLQEQLKDLPKLQSITMIAVLWFIWHLNFEFTRSNMIFLGVLFLGSWGIGKVYSKTYSLLAVAGFHSLNNFFRHGLHQTELILIVILLAIWIGFIIRYDSYKKYQDIQ
ncbi:CPBP family intramembrane glutamic endopeptidase [Chryseobacterium daecheongense]|uniref:CAAX prenyl protease-like protein n=1 Tax=Chryseobacterium daecheongense TaxID=192389 RepID=A0A3N0VYH7_9FLAO|nr:CPBP family intramembrane glutamic endopeptidase [Chryseobacterium daecheongense]ROH97856.1 CPBP family intramembrane metalloprotease [Chryseobacterium daecheongense]TDX92970.1 CAAX prenyl protease-like protein [Chryseobacterium daecheongense]